MAKPRSELSAQLNAILASVDPLYGTKHCYFRKPSTKMNYPCIIYERDDRKNYSADNLIYAKYDHYTVTVIDYDPDSQIASLVEELQWCSYDREYQADGLNHFVYSIYI